jgi:predicted dehydrogenase/serine acetyltransferase
MGLPYRMLDTSRNANVAMFRFLGVFSCLRNGMNTASFRPFSGVIMATQANIAVVGCGYWGKNLVRNMAQLGALACVADANSQQAEAMSKEHNVPARSWEEVLADDAIKGVMLPVPAQLHYELAMQALNAGKHVFVEKPMALEPAEAEAMCAKAREKNKILMVGHVLQYHSAYLEMQNWVRSGKLGRLHYIYSHRLNLGKVRAHENCWWSFAPHDISMALGLAGSAAKSVFATGTEALQAGIADMTTTHIEFEDGLKAHILVSWLHPTKEQRLVVAGEKGMLVFDDGQPWESKLLYYPHAVDLSGRDPVVTKADAQSVTLTQSEPLKEECLAFIRAIETGTQPKTNGDEGLAVLEILAKAEDSMQLGKPILIHSDPAPYFVHETAVVDKGCVIGEGSKIWHFSHILSGTTLGRNVIIGQNVMVGPNVSVADGCKIQNNVSLYKGVHLEEGVFCGPSCVFTNVNTPRAAIERKDEFLETHVGKWATIGANATIVCGNAIGAYALIGAGAVVTKPVKPHALMVGNPAQAIGWVSHAGERLGDDLVCPREGRKYRITKQDQLEEIKDTKHAAA